MEKKMTKKDYFKELATVVEASEVENQTDLLSFIAHEIELLEKKSSNSKQTKTQKENENIMTEILVALEKIGGKVTVTELMKSNDAMAAYSNQKLSALLKKLVDSGEVIKVVEKKKSYFSLA